MSSCACNANEFCQHHIQSHLGRREFGRMQSGDLLFGWPDDVYCIHCDTDVTKETVMAHLRDAHDITSHVMA